MDKIIIGIISIIITILFFEWLKKYGDKQLLSAMRSDGLTEKEIIKIIGIDEYERMIK